MDTKLLLVKCITLLYLQSLLTESKNDRVEMVVQKVLEYVKPVDKSITTDFGHDTISQLRETVVWMLSRTRGEPFTQSDLKQRFILNTQDDTYIFNALTHMFFPEDEEINDEKVNKNIRSNIYDINVYIDRLKITEVLKDFYKKTQFQADTLDWTNLVHNINENLSPYKDLGSGKDKATSHPSIVGGINFNDVEDIQSAFVRTKDELSSLGAIKLPYQGWNRLLGPQRGIRRGEFGLFSALQHNYKSGALIDSFISCAIENIPYMRDETKKPLNLRISFENTVEQDIKILYERLYEQEYNLRVDVESLDVEVASKYVHERLSVNGYYNQLIYIDPSDYTILDLISLLEEKMEEGYEIHLLTIDYLNLMSKKYLNQGPHGEEIRDLFRRTRNFTSKNGIACLTAHQLSSDAKGLVRQGASNFLEAIANKGYYDGCKRIDQEVDLEVYLHIEEVNGEKFLASRRGKHRGVRTPMLDQFTVYKFDEISGLPYDLHKADLSRKTVGGNTIAEGGASAWWDGVAA